MTPSPDHDRWLSAAQAGDRKAMERLLALHSNGVYRYGLRVCRTTEDAEDALQETLWAVTRAIKTFRGAATSITAWMFTIIRHQCYRSLARWHRAEHADLPTPFQLTAEDEHLALEQRRLLADAMATLPPLDRLAVLLRDVEGMTAPEAAEVMRVSVAALKSRLHRARTMLREAISAGGVDREREQHPRQRLAGGCAAETNAGSYGPRTGTRDVMTNIELIHDDTGPNVDAAGDHTRAEWRRDDPAAVSGRSS